MGWFDWLRKNPRPQLHHPVFGAVRAAHRPSGRPWMWESVDLIETDRGHVSLTFSAGESGPRELQEQQWQHVLRDLDRLTRSAGPLVADELKGWEDWGVGFDPNAPWSELVWEDANLFGDTDAQHDFALIYGCKSWPDAMITIYFKDDRPMLSQLDD